MEDEDKFVDCEVTVEEEDPAHETRGAVATREKPGTPAVVQTGECSRHERIWFMTIDDRAPDSFIHVVANNVAVHIKHKSRTGWCGTPRSHPSAVFLVQ